MSELREAAERLRQNQYIADTDLGATSFGQISDLLTVARAWLAEHPADSELPIDEPWLRSVCGPHLPPMDYKRYALCIAHKNGMNVCWCPPRGSLPPLLCINTSIVKENPTRGDLLKLCSALGLTLKGTHE